MRRSGLRFSTSRSCMLKLDIESSFHLWARSHSPLGIESALTQVHSLRKHGGQVGREGRQRSRRRDGATPRVLSVQNCAGKISTSVRLEASQASSELAKPSRPMMRWLCSMEVTKAEHWETAISSPTDQGIESGFVADGECPNRSEKERVKAAWLS
jgi:hypothetical protein